MAVKKPSDEKQTAENRGERAIPKKNLQATAKEPLAEEDWAAICREWRETEQFCLVCGSRNEASYRSFTRAATFPGIIRTSCTPTQ